MQKQKIFNEIFQKTCEKELLKIKNIHDEIEQKIKNIKANKNNRAIIKFINIFEEVRKIKQNISNTSIKERSFASAKII